MGLLDRLVAGGTDFLGAAQIMTSDDGGDTWTVRAQFGAQPSEVSGMAYGAGIFVAVGYSAARGRSALIATSPDGEAWTARGAPMAGISSLSAIAWDGSQWIAGGVSDGAPYTRILTSPDAVNWTARTTPYDLPSSPQSPIYCLAGNGSLWVAGMSSQSGATEPAMITSPDGVTWVPRATPFDGEGTYSVAYGAGIWVAVGVRFRDPEVVMTSPNGLDWTARSTPFDDHGHASAVASDGSMFVIGGDNHGASGGSGVLTSSDGVDWAQPVIPFVGNNLTWRAAAWDPVGERWIVFGSFNATSPDGVNWTWHGLNQQSNRCVAGGGFPSASVPSQPSIAGSMLSRLDQRRRVRTFRPTTLPGVRATPYTGDFGSTN